MKTRLCGHNCDDCPPWEKEDCEVFAELERMILFCEHHISVEREVVALREENAALKRATK